MAAAHKLLVVEAEQRIGRVEKLRVEDHLQNENGDVTWLR